MSDEHEFEEQENITDDDEQQGSYLCNLKYLRELTKSVAKDKEIQIGTINVKKLNNTIEYLAVALLYELIGVLDSKSRIRVTPEYIDEALSKLFEQANAYGTVLVQVETLRDELANLNSNTSLSRAVEFINLRETTLEDKSNGN